MSPTRALAILRIALGAIILARTTPLLAPFGFRFAVSPLLGWPDGRFHISAIALPSLVVGALAITRTIAALGFVIGYRARICGVVASLTGYAVLAQDALAYVNSLHLLYLSTFIVALTDCACDLAIRKESARSLRSSVWLARGVPLSVYAFSGFAKLNAQFLSGRALLGFCDDGYVRGFARLVCAPGPAGATSIAVAIGELALPVALALPFTRRPAIALALTLHVALEIAMGPDVFGWIMSALLLSFVAATRPAPSENSEMKRRTNGAGEGENAETDVLREVDLGASRDTQRETLVELELENQSDEPNDDHRARAVA